jgi:DNA polymerase
MALELDTRQRAMLQEMGVHVWLPDVAAAPVAVQSLPADVVPALPSTPVVQERVTRPAAVNAAARAPSAPAATPAMAAQAGEPLALQDLNWIELAQAASTCQACGLCAGRKHATLLAPATPAQADWLVVGDPPDEDEDRVGQPFVEQAGVLLDNMLKAALTIRGGVGRAGAHLSNVVKCRPPPGRLPQAVELAQCAQYLQREIQLVQPKVILAMGRFAAQLLLEEHPLEAALPLGKQRGRVYRYRGIAVVVTYHPKVLLRASADKAKAWADLCLAMDILEGAPSIQ